MRPNYPKSPLLIPQRLLAHGPRLCMPSGPKAQEASRPTSMHAVQAPRPCCPTPPPTGHGPRETALSHHYAVSLVPGPWSASRRSTPCTLTYIRSSSAVQASLSPRSVISSPLRLLASRVLVGHTSTRSGSTCRFTPCPRPSPARVLIRLALVLMMS